MTLNDRAAELVDAMTARAGMLGVAVTRDASTAGATLVDCGVRSLGGLEAGVRLAEVCMAGLGRVDVCHGVAGLWDGPALSVRVDAPLAGCLASQYAGWQVARDDYFAMGSGPMRAMAGKEDLFARIGQTENAAQAVGVLEAAKLPPAETILYLADAIGLPPDRLALLVAPTASIAGTVQVVARSVETAMHKLFELGFDVSQVVSGFGIAPLPPVAADDLVGIGRTNDAILYGGKVTLWLAGGGKALATEPSPEDSSRGTDAKLSDEEIAAIGPQVPSSASSDHGQPFAEIFRRYNGDFYQIDPHLFSPAEITLVNLDTGRAFHYGSCLPEVFDDWRTT
ncbi:MAG: methenyltetrahydromethanopterin cyclohydrolase [Pirellulales bacterium]